MRNELPSFQLRAAGGKDGFLYYDTRVFGHGYCGDKVTGTLNMKKEDQQDTTIRCLLLTSVSTCFGHHYAHLQENKGPVTAFGVSFCNKLENVDISREVFFV